MEKLHWVNQKNAFNSHSEILPKVLMLPREDCSITITTIHREHLSLLGQNMCTARN